MFTVIDPYNVMLTLHQIKDALMKSPYTINLLPLLDEEIKTLENNSRGILKDAHKLSRQLNQRTQRNLFEKKYDKLIQTVENFINSYPLCSVAERAVAMVKKIISYCVGEQLHYVMLKYEYLQIKTRDYHDISTSILPLIKLSIKIHIQITDSLLSGSPDIEMIYLYLTSGKYDDDVETLDTNKLFKQQEVAPNWVLYYN